MFIITSNINTKRAVEVTSEAELKEFNFWLIFVDPDEFRIYLFFVSYEKYCCELKQSHDSFIKYNNFVLRRKIEALRVLFVCVWCKTMCDISFFEILYIREASFTFYLNFFNPQSMNVSTDASAIKNYMKFGFVVHWNKIF